MTEVVAGFFASEPEALSAVRQKVSAQVPGAIAAVFTIWPIFRPARASSLP